MIGAIELQDIEYGIRLGREDFETRVLKSSINELSKSDKKFLLAMNVDNGESNIADIEKRLGKNRGYVSMYRARLIESGVIEPAGRGRLRFALPGLREYLIKTYGEQE